MSTRRQFIKQSSITSLAALAAPSLLLKPSYPLGLQLYTLHKEMQTDLEGTLKKIASFGYKEVETYGFNYGPIKNYWNMEATTLKKILDANGLKSVSGHYHLDKFLLPGKTPDDLKRYVDECIAGALELGQAYIVWPYLDESLRSINQFKLVASTLNIIGEQIKKANLQLAYHNHHFEFIDYNGQTGYDIILNETDSNLVKIELDIYWFTHSSKLPAHYYFSKYPKRFPLLHLKDMDKNNRELHTVMGDGVIDFSPYLADAELAGVKHLLVEQGNNYVPNALDCVQRSASFVKNNLLR
ncbi:MAG: hypothetical protein RL172_1235 [Bacteroidota bacterium]